MYVFAVDRYEGGADEPGEGAALLTGGASTGGMTDLFLSRLNQDMAKYEIVL